ncbi:MAG TPA: hypothetical protein VJS67_05800 [Pseudonocardiaceae bacterium]|nr:hypothetical protein [Pseudonocardiaceae bacterium]
MPPQHLQAAPETELPGLGTADRLHAAVAISDDKVARRQPNSRGVELGDRKAAERQRDLRLESSE